MIIVSRETGHGELTMLHSKIFCPTLNPVTKLVSAVGEIIFPVPATKVHVAEPITGKLPMSVAESLHNTWSRPALACVEY